MNRFIGIETTCVWLIAMVVVVITEDLAAVGVDTNNLEIFGGAHELNAYYVRFDDNIDPLQLSLQLSKIESIDWAQPNYLYYSTQSRDPYRNRPNYDGDWWIDEIKLDAARRIWNKHKTSTTDPVEVAVIETTWFNSRKT